MATRPEYYGKWHDPLHRARVYQNSVAAAGIRETEFGPGLERRFDNYLDDIGIARRDPVSGEQHSMLYGGRPYEPYKIDAKYGMEPTKVRELIRADGKMRPVTQPDEVGVIKDVPDEHSRTAYEANNGIEALQRLAERDEPFHLHVDFWMPHAPLTATEGWAGRHEPADVDLPASLDDDMEDSPYRGGNARGQLAGYRDPQKARTFIAAYYDLVEEVDHHVGRLLDELETLGLADDTLVIFCSDHGEMLSAHGMREKNVFFEESARVPMLLRLPGVIPAGKVVEDHVTEIDLFATICDYAGAETPPSHGRSWRGLIDGKGRDDDFIVTEWHFHGPKQPNYMVRSGRWKWYGGYDVGNPTIDVLHDLHADPHEMTNLLASDPKPEHLDVTRELRGKLVDWLVRVDGPSEAIDGLEKRPLYRQ